jgi:hypothetical protein
MVGIYKFVLVALGVVSVAASSLIGSDLELKELSIGKGGCSPHNEATRKEWFVLDKYLETN